MAEEVVSLLGEYICGTNLSPVLTKEALKGKTIGLYFSAYWCPPCRAFAPVLSKFQEKNASDFQVVYISNDKSEAEMVKNLEGKPFFAVAFSQVERRTQLSLKYSISMIPTLVILNENGEFITDWGRSAVSKNPEGCITEWKEKKHGVSWMQLLNPL